MAAPSDNNKFCFRHQIRARNNDYLRPHENKNKEVNEFPTANARFARPIGESGENSMRGFAANQFRPNSSMMLPPHAVPDILIKQNESNVPNRLTSPVQTPERLTVNMGSFPTEIPPQFLGPPPLNHQPFNSQRIRHPFVPQQQMIPDSANRMQDFQDAMQKVGRDLENGSQVQEDRKWLEHWLNQIKQRHTESERQQPIILSEIQSKTRYMLVLIAKLQKQKQVLETLKEEDKSIWDQKVYEIERLKAELEHLQSYLTSDDTLTKLDKKILSRKKKRERLKRLRQEKYEQQCEDQAQREQQHSEIDRNLEKIRQKEKDAKQEKDLQKEVDNILGQVRKKITENSRAMQLLQSLQKLRQMRKDRQDRQSARIAGVGNDNVFNTKVGHLRAVLEKQDQVYKAEESALKVILETEQEETREKEREKDRQREMERQKQEEMKVEQALFGTYKEPRPDDPLYPFKQYYDAANCSFEAFLNIRHEWDKYLVLEGTLGGSRIPDTWVIPPEPSSDVWASALHNR